ncbi:MAG: sigma-54 interaction domain-containing protein [Gemmatimonadota bacterium]
MADVFVDARNVEAAVAVREAVKVDGHEVSLVESAKELEGRVREGAEVALFVTGDPEDRETARLLSRFSHLIPRPPVIAVAETDAPDELHRVAHRLDVDECLGSRPDPEEVRVVLTQQLERFFLQRETGIIGRTEEIREVLERVHQISPVHSTVLLTGESGTGKELVARGIHRLSPRRGKPFIAVNCAALAESILESELFGHEKGAFTGATSLRRGMFELADGGTLLLDEIAEMSPSTQTRLLRVLESRRFMRVGGDREIEVNVRVIAATNRDLREAVRAGSFRRDLYYRLNVLRIHLPPLRDRRKDISILVQRFVREFTRQHDREFKGISEEAKRILLDYSWPGNVRELRNLIESMVVLAPGSVIRPEDIPAEIRSGAGAALLPVRAGGAVPERRSGAAELPEMEFVFRTLVELKLDVEDLRREFERYKERHPELVGGPLTLERGGTEIELASFSSEEPPEEAPESPGEPAEEGTLITFSPGMTMAELEREAIVATLKEVGGNRRKAAAKLQIGERTLYRKLKEYEIDL